MPNQKQPSPIAKEELQKLGTHATGSPDQFETRKTSTPQKIDPPEVPNAGSTGAY